MVFENFKENRCSYLSEVSLRRTDESALVPSGPILCTSVRDLPTTSLPHLLRTSLLSGSFGVSVCVCNGVFF